MGATIGALLPVPYSLYAVFLSIILTGITACIYLIIHKNRARQERQNISIPLFPYFLAGLLVVYFLKYFYLS